MAKKCKPSKKVSDAGKKLSTSKSKATKSKAGKTLSNHKQNKH